MFTNNYDSGVGELPMVRLVRVAAACLLVAPMLLVVAGSTVAQDVTTQQLKIVRPLPGPIPTPVPPRAGPAPLVGVGLPLFACVLGVLMFMRGYWRKQ